MRKSLAFGSQHVSDFRNETETENRDDEQVVIIFFFAPSRARVDNFSHSTQMRDILFLYISFLFFSRLRLQLKIITVTESHSQQKKN